MVLTSALAFRALVVVLATQDGKPVHRWGFLTLNAIVAILSTVAGSALAALVGSGLSQSLWNGFAQHRKEEAAAVARPFCDLDIYNEASRGPMGSLTLLLRHGPLSIAPVGSLATILNLAFATFTQQLVTSETRMPSSDVAHPFARSQTYRTDFNLVGVQACRPQQSVVLEMQAAIISAALQGNNAQPLTPDCVTGNSTYSNSIPTLAVHGECKDVSDDLDNTGPCRWTKAPCNESSTADCGALGQPCTYRLPTGPSLKWQPGNNASDLYVLWNATNLLESGGTVGDFHSRLPSIAYPDDSEERSYIMRFAAVGLTPEAALSFIDSNDGGGGTLPPMVATECAVWPSECLRLTEASNQGYYADHDLISLDFYNLNITNGSSKVDLVSSHTYLASSSYEEYSRMVFLGPNSGWAVGDVPYGFDPASGLDALRDALAKLMPYSNSYVSATWMPSLPFAFGQTDDPQFNFIEGMYRHSDNLQNWTANLAQELTNRLAISSPAQDDRTFDGVAFVSET